MTARPSTAPPKRLRAALEHYHAGRLDDAERACRALLAAGPADPHALHLCGVVALSRDDPAAAVSLIEQAVALAASEPDFLANLGEVYRVLDRLADAEQALRRALALRPDDPGAQNNLGLVLAALGRFDEAQQCYRSAIAAAPALARARLNSALLHLLRGELATGFALYESRYQGAEARQIDDARDLRAALADVTAWTGQDLAGRTLLVWTEQGFGDSLMMLRYLPLLEARGVERLVVHCADPLARLVAAMPCVDEVVPQSRAVPTGGIDLHCSLMSLPFLFRTDIDTVPCDVPYLAVPAAAAQYWQARLRTIAPPRVGLVWAGGQRTRSEARRSLQPEDLAPLRQATAVSFVSLQKDADRVQRERTGLDLLDPMADCHDFLDTAALVGQLDLVVSVDTSVAHLAAALGRPTWLLLRHHGAWQWMLEREDSPWYPSMRIFRQRPDGDWGAPLARVAAALGETIAPSRAAHASAGRRPAWAARLFRRWR